MIARTADVRPLCSGSGLPGTGQSLIVDAKAGGPAVSGARGLRTWEARSSTGRLSRLHRSAGASGIKQPRSDATARRRSQGDHRASSLESCNTLQGARFLRLWP